MKINNNESNDSDQQDCMLFGFDRHTDEKSLATFLQKIVAKEMLDILIPRLEDQEIDSVVNLFTGFMKKHLNKDEYHDLFLGNG